MSWRDNPEIIWQDDDGDRLAATYYDVLAMYNVDHEGGAEVQKPESLAERIEATERWLAAHGLAADNIREKPRPVEVGDWVEIAGLCGQHEVLAGPWDEHGELVAVVRLDVESDGGISVVSTDDMTHAPEHEAKPEWVVTRDPQEVAAALDAGRPVQYRAVGRGWADTDATAAIFREAASPLSDDYRYEGPRVVVLAAEIAKVEAPVERCTPDNRTCGHDENRCLKSVAGFRLVGGGPCDWWCFRPVGHDGDCIPCDPYLYVAHHNLHLRPEDR